MPHALTRDDGRLSAPQHNVLRLLREGWACRTCGRDPGPFQPLVAYGFHRGGETRWATGTTLGSLQRRGWIAWEATTLTLAYDGSQVAGWTLILTLEAQAQCTDD